ncbi:MAG: hypothetical protein ABIH76_08040 [Candidatus Bathyarchaeota archaeon]
MKLDEKIRNFAARETRLQSFMDMSFGDNFLKVPLETVDGHVIEATFCDGYQHLKYLAALSVQAGCAVKCKFCDVESFKRNLTADELLDQLALLLRTAIKRGYNIFKKPVKATLVNGGDALLNSETSQFLEAMNEQIPLQAKISTIFPAAKNAWNTYEAIVQAAQNYSNIVQFQISLNSTSEEYRQSITAMPLANFQTIRKAGELWMSQVSNPRKLDLTFTLNADTPMNPYDIQSILPPSLFAIRLRDYVTTESGEKNSIARTTYETIETIKAKFENLGYTFIPGMSGKTENRFKLAPGELLRTYKAMKQTM